MHWTAKMRLPRALFDLSALAHEARQLLYAVRKEHAKGPLAGPIRSRLKVRLIQVRNRFQEIQRDIIMGVGLTSAQLQQGRKELGAIVTIIREVEKISAGEGSGPPDAG